MVGYVGLALLLSAYVLLVTKWSKYFIPLDIIASLVLLYHGVLIRDVPMAVSNGFIAALLTVKLAQRKTRIE